MQDLAISLIAQNIKQRAIPFVLTISHKPQARLGEPHKKWYFPRLYQFHDSRWTNFPRDGSDLASANFKTCSML